MTTAEKYAIITMKSAHASFKGAQQKKVVTNNGNQLAI